MVDIRDAQLEYRDDASRGAGEYASTLSALKLPERSIWKTVESNALGMGWPHYYTISTHREYSQAVTTKQDAQHCLIRLWHTEGKLEWFRCDGTADHSMKKKVN